MRWNSLTAASVPRRKTVHQQLGDCRIVVGNPVELPLEDPHILAGTALAQGDTGIGALDALHRRAKHDIDIITEIVLEYFVGYQSLIREIHRTPLGQAVAGGGGSVAVLGEKRLDAPCRTT